MKNGKIFVLIVLSFLCSCSLQKRNITEYPRVIFDISCCDTFPITSLSGCDPIAHLYNDFEYELFPSPLTITGEKSGKFIILLVVDDKLISGLVDKNIPVSIQLRQNGSVGVPVHKRATVHSHSCIIGYDKFVTRSLESYPVVYDYQGDWLKVSFIDKKNHIKFGWINKTYQCDNPYSTCN